MYKLLDVVTLLNDDDTHGVKKGCIGTIVDVHAGGAAYTVEFFDDNWETIEASLFTEYKQEDLAVIEKFSG